MTEPVQNLPPFETLFPELFWANAAVLSADQLRRIAEALDEEARRAVGAAVAAAGSPPAGDALPEDKAQVLSAYPMDPGAGAETLAARYPDILVATCAVMDAAQLRQVLGLTSDNLLAAQSRAMGLAGRRRAFGAMEPAKVEVILDATPDPVLLQAGAEALAQIRAYTTTLLKNERIDRKLQGVETIQVKFRLAPKAFYMRWVDGPFKGRQVLFNEKLLGENRLRVREGGLLGLAAVTIPVDSPIARRGTRHQASELGLHYLLDRLEQDFHRAAPAGHLSRRNHGIVTDANRRLYKMESLLPRDQALGYYCHRMVHYTDYLQSLDVKFDIFGWDDQLAESYDYQDLVLNPALSDTDFDPKNRSYKL